MQCIKSKMGGGGESSPGVLNTRLRRNGLVGTGYVSLFISSYLSMAIVSGPQFIMMDN